MPIPVIPVASIMPLLYAALEVINLIKDSRDIDPNDKAKLIEMINQAQISIKTWEEL